jgi:hypothetical protein
MIGTIKKMIITMDGQDYLVTKTGLDDTYILDSLDNGNVKGFLISGGQLRQMISF